MLRSLALAALMGVSAVTAADATCDKNNKCPKETPCCSTYGQCGVGAFCLGGCDPSHPFSLDSCVPGPVCKDRSMKFENLNRVADVSDYLGDSDSADWVAQGEPAIFDNNLLLTMPKNSVGTVLSSTVYMWYGNVKARFKTSRGNGVITAFILFSNVKDEIDFEFIGADLGTAQTNYYFQGITDYHNSGNISASDTFNNWHEYEIRWTPDKIEWLIDGKVGRSKNKADTWNETSQNFQFPQTPARVQLSLWPGGLATNKKGTVDWAGGEINWDSVDIKNYGYYFATFSDVEIECYNADNAPGTNKKKSYYYSDIRGTNDTIVDSDKDHTIASLQATGLDPDKGKKSTSKSTSSKTSSDKSAESSEAASIPGGSTNGPSGDDHSSDDGSSSSGSSGSNGSSSGGSSSGGSSSDGSSTNQADTSNCNTSSFNQDCGKSSSSSSSDSSDGKSMGSRSSASALAIIIAGCALFWL